MKIKSKHLRQLLEDLESNHFEYYNLGGIFQFRTRNRDNSRAWDMTTRVENPYNTHEFRAINPKLWICEELDLTLEFE